jgi:hypothetical protein
MDAREHAPGGARQKLLAWTLDREVRAIRRGARLRFGSSLVAVARCA